MGMLPVLKLKCPIIVFHLLRVPIILCNYLQIIYEYCNKYKPFNRVFILEFFHGNYEQVKGFLMHFAFCWITISVWLWYSTQLLIFVGIRVYTPYKVNYTPLSSKYISIEIQLISFSIPQNPQELNKYLIPQELNKYLINWYMLNFDNDFFIEYNLIQLIHNLSWLSIG